MANNHIRRSAQAQTEEPNGAWREPIPHTNKLVPYPQV